MMDLRSYFSREVPRNKLDGEYNSNTVRALDPKEDKENAETVEIKQETLDEEEDESEWDMSDEEGTAFNSTQKPRASMEVVKSDNSMEPETSEKQSKQHTPAEDDDSAWDLTNTDIAMEQESEPIKWEDDSDWDLSEEDEIDQGERRGSQPRLKTVASKNGVDLKCKLCDEEVSTPRAHVVRMHLKKKRYECPECKLGNATKGNIKSHIRKVHVSKVGLEPINNSDKLMAEIQKLQKICFPNRIMRARPGDINPEIKMNYCQLCNEQTTQMKHHVLVKHLKEKLFKCPECDYGYSEKPILHRHMNQKHPNSEAQPIDNSAKFSTEIRQLYARCFPNSRLQHRRPLNGAKKKGGEWACKLCNEETRHPKKHILLNHLDHKLYECPECSMAGKKLHNVADHIRRMHPKAIGIKPIDNSAKHSAEIQRLHEVCFPNRKKVTAGKIKQSYPIYECKMCNKKVNHPNRDGHMFTQHLKLRLFECPICDFFSLSNVYDIRKHIKWDHKEQFGKVKPISHEKKYEKEISALTAQCFPGWERILRVPTQSSKRKRVTEDVDMAPSEASDSGSESMSHSDCESDCSKVKSPKNGRSIRSREMSTKRKRTLADKEDKSGLDDSKGVKGERRRSKLRE